MSTRLRPIEFIIQPVVVADDGEHLTRIEVQQIVVDAVDLDGFPAEFREQLAEKEALLEVQPDEPQPEGPQPDEPDQADED